MTNSLADLCRRADASVRFAMMPDRRQIADRRRSQRGGRRKTDIEATASTFPALWGRGGSASDESNADKAAEYVMTAPLAHA